jgi:hypothetical protein
MPKFSTVLTGLSIGAAAALMVLIALASDLRAYRPAVDRLAQPTSADYAGSRLPWPGSVQRHDGRPGRAPGAVGGHGNGRARALASAGDA